MSVRAGRVERGRMERGRMERGRVERRATTKKIKCVRVEEKKKKEHCVLLIVSDYSPGPGY